MKQIGVFSGKGGTGKTTLTACFAHLAGPVVAVDADVDAANLSLLLPGTERHVEPFFAGERARIDPEQCTGCGLCAEACRFHAIAPSSEVRGHYEVDPLACEGCRLCRSVCPEEAVSLSANQAGDWMLRELDFGSFLVHAELGVAQDNSGKLVARVREEARQLAEKEERALILVDGPPGIGCPVHAALGKLDALLAVTEPTPSGEHDLLRLLEVAGHFHVPAYVAINKWDLHEGASERIAVLCEERGAPLLGRIPFDPAVPRALSRGELPLGDGVAPETSASIRALWQALWAEVANP